MNYNYMHVHEGAPGRPEAIDPLWLYSGLPRRHSIMRGRNPVGQLGPLLGRCGQSLIPYRRENGKIDYTYPDYEGEVNLANGYLRLPAASRKKPSTHQHVSTAAQPTASGGTVYVTTNSNYWHRFDQIRASEPLNELLPEGFPAASFMKGGKLPDTANLVAF